MFEVQKEMAKRKFHHNIPILRRLYLQRDEARNQREKALRELDEARNQREQALRELDEARNQGEKALRELDEARNQREQALRELDEARNQGEKALRELDDVRANACLAFSFSQLAHSVPEPQFVSHSKSVSYLSSMFNRPDVRIIEIGSRNVTGGVFRELFSAADYIGFDFYEGENVDLVGDAHKLSSYFGDEEKFDLIFSSAVFEHFHMPWIVAQEIQKLLKIGGYVFVETHFSFATHERPWNFFQFSDMGLRALFNSALGFELLDCGMSNRINGVFSQESDEYLRGKPIGEMYCHSEIFCKKIREVREFDWSKADIDDIVANTRYPAPKTLA